MYVTLFIDWLRVLSLNNVMTFYFTEFNIFDKKVYV